LHAAPKGAFVVALNRYMLRLKAFLYGRTPLHSPKGVLAGP